MGADSGCDIPETLIYAVEREVWAGFKADGRAPLGMTDPAQTREDRPRSSRPGKHDLHADRPHARRVRLRDGVITIWLTARTAVA